MTSQQSLDRAAVAHGLRAGLLLVVPAGLFTAAFSDDLSELLKAIFVVVIIAGFITAGSRAARRAEQAAMASAATAAALTYLSVQLPLSAVRLIRGESLNIWTYIFLVLTSMSSGVIGGLFGLRALHRAELREAARPGSEET